MEKVNLAQVLLLEPKSTNVYILLATYHKLKNV